MLSNLAFNNVPTIVSSKEAVKLLNNMYGRIKSIVSVTQQLEDKLG